MHSKESCRGLECPRTDIEGYGYCGKHYQRYTKYGDAEVVHKSTGGVDTSIDPETGLPAYIERKIIRVENGCWLWQGRLCVAGYGAVRYQKKLWGAHRLVYVLLKGTFDLSLELDHKYSAEGCARNCVNPEHLEPVTGTENKRRVGERRTHCPSGHEYTLENTYIAKGVSGNYKRCRKCGIVASRKYQNKRDSR